MSRRDLRQVSHERALTLHCTLRLRGFCAHVRLVHFSDKSAVVVSQFCGLLCTMGLFQNKVED
jgi:hypothetical protein